MKKMLLAGTAMTMVLLAACGSDANPTASPSPTATVDWEARTVRVSGVDGYEIAFCEGDAPFLCVTRSSEPIGAIELVSFPDDAPLADGVEAWVDEMTAWLAEDRRAGCDPGYEAASDEVTAAPFGGRAGYRYGFTGTVDGRVVERIVRHVVVVDGEFHSLALNALADDGCVARESELPLDASDDLEPVLAALAAGSTNLPEVETPPAEERSGWLRGRSDEGVVDLDHAVMLSGDEAVAAAREDGELPPDGQLPNDFYIDDDEPDVTSYPVSDRLVVELYDCTAGCELRPVDAQAFLRHQVEPFGGEHALVAIDLQDGVVVGLREIYVP